MVHRITLTGSVALMIFMGTLLFAGPAQAAGPCDTLTEGTQAYVKDLTLHHLPNVSHWIQQEAPETVNEMIEAWLCRGQ